MTRLAEMKCTPAAKGAERLHGDRLAELKSEVPEWELIEEHRLRRRLKFPDFASALAFVNRVGELAERESHHPDIGLSWGAVEIVLWTHSVGGLSRSDFILAAKIDSLPRP